MAVRAWIIHGPVTGKIAAVAHAELALWIAVNIGIAEPRAYPLSLGVGVAWNCKIFVLDSRIFFEWPLRADQAPGRNHSNKSNRECGAGTHRQRSFAGFRITQRCRGAATSIRPQKCGKLLA